MFALTKQIKSQEERKMLEEFEFLMETAWQKVLADAEDTLWEMRKPLEEEEEI